MTPPKTVEACIERLVKARGKDGIAIVSPYSDRPRWEIIAGDNTAYGPTLLGALKKACRRLK